MKTKIKAIALALALALGLSFTALGVVAAEVQALRHSGAAEPDQAPGIYKVTEGAKLERAYRQQPPLVPHPTDKYEIDVKVNQCLRCHEWPYSDQEKAPKISDLHYIDRNGVRQDTVNGNRYFCKQCHVPQNDAKPLVENKFQAATTNTNIR
ncbi:MAG: nitrate reductase cytochrome c-type subunit [Magnetospirillum sp.]|nr:nitrate reductase cytochrome c-type subunit [Magnetospirillum sp.]